MKKTIASIMLIILLSISTIIYATSDYSSTIKKSKDVLSEGDVIEITLSIEDKIDERKGINILLATLEYDQTIFERVNATDIKVGEKWGGLTYNNSNGMMVIDSAEFVKENKDIITVTLRAKQEINETKNLEIGFKNIQGSFGVSDLNMPDAFTNIEIIKENTTNNIYVYIIAIALLIIVVASSIIIVIKRRKSNK